MEIVKPLNYKDRTDNLIKIGREIILEHKKGFDSLYDLLETTYSIIPISFYDASRLQSALEYIIVDAKTYWEGVDGEVKDITDYELAKAIGDYDSIN